MQPGGVSANVTRGGLAAAGLFDEAARAQRFELRLELAQLFLGRVLEVREDVSRRFLRADQLVELELDRLAVPVLRRLDEEDHQEGDDGGARVDHQLPAVGEAEHRSADRPAEHDRQRDQEGGMRADRRGDAAGESAEPAFTRGRVHDFNLATRRISATLRKAEVLERDLDARTPVAEVRSAERPQPRPAERSSCKSVTLAANRSQGWCRTGPRQST